MARPLWKGSLGFGLVTIPVGLYTAEDRHDLSFTLLDSRNMSRVRYQRVNEETGKEVPWSDIVKGYEYTDGNFVVVTDEDFKRAAVEQTRTIQIEDFVDRSEVSPIYFSTPYYVMPEKGGEHAFELLRESLARTGKLGIARVVIRTRQHLAAVMPYDDVMLLHVLRFNQEIKEVPAHASPKAKIAAKELDMAQKLIDAMVGEWKPDKYHDEYHDKLVKWIHAKAEHGGKVPPPEKEEEEIPPTYNIMELLKQSVNERGKPSRAKASGTGPSTPPSRARKTTKRAAPAARRRKAG
jgi:DNA end-binding protein Ku